MTEPQRLDGPYRGLTPYTEGDAVFFYGRDTERKIIASNLLARRLTILYGPSGVGKSSVLRAGVAHQLREEAEREPRFPDDVEPEYAVTVFNAWRDDPLTGLVEAVRKDVATLDRARSPAPRAPPPTAAPFTERADRQDPLPNGLALALRDLSAGLRGGLLIILDQFEEYFLYHGQEDGNRTFAAQFPRAVNDRELPVAFLISIRDDALAELDLFKGRIPSLFDSYLRIDHLDRQAAREAIVRPVEMYNRLAPQAHDRGTQTSGGAGPIVVEPELIDAVLDEVQTGQVLLGQTGRGVVVTPGAGDTAGIGAVRIETPFLQLVMTRLWDEEMASGSRVLRAATLKRLGGAERIVRSHLDRALEAFSEPEQDVAADLFRYLVTPGGTKIAHTVEDLAEYVRLPVADVTPILEHLAASDVRIVRPVASRYEIFHDVLASPILDWRARHVQAREQAERERERREAEARTQQELRRLQELARAQRRATRLLAIVAALLAVFLVAATVTIYWVLGQNRKARAGELAAGALAQIPVDPMRSVQLATRAVQTNENADTVQALRRSVVASSVRAGLRDPTGWPFESVAFSPDGTTVAAGGRGALELWRWGSNEGQHMRLEAGTGQVTGVAFSPDGSKVLAVTSAQGIVRVWDMRSPAERVPMVLEVGALVSSAEFSRDGRYLVTADGDGSVQVWEPGQRSEPIARRQIGEVPLLGASFAESAAAVVTASMTGSITVWRWRNAKPPLTLRGGTGGGAQSAAFSVDGRFVATGGSDGTVRIWEVAALGERPRVIRTATGSGGATIVAFALDAAHLVRYTASDRILAVLDRDSGGTVTELQPGSTVHAVAFSPDPAGRFVATADDDHTARVFSWSGGAPQPVVLRGHTGAVRSVAFAPDGSSVVTGSVDGTARVWLWQRNGNPIGVATPGDPVQKVAIDQARRRVAIGTEAGSVELWSVADASLVDRLQLSGSISGLAVSPDGGSIVAGTTEGAVVVWPWQSGGEPVELSIGVQVQRVAFGPDGTSVVAAGGDDVTRLWRSVPAIAPIAPIEPIELEGTFITQNGTKDLLLTAAVDGTVRVYSAGSGKEQASLSPVVGAPVRAAFAPDGQTVLLGGARGARLWEPGTGAVTELKDQPAALVERVAFNRDGTEALTVSGGKTRVWQLPANEPPLQVDGGSSVFSPDGLFVFTRSAEGEPRVWDIASGRPAITLGAPVVTFFPAAFTPDGLTVIAVDSSAIHAYDCDVCVPVDRLLDLATARVPPALAPVGAALEP